MDWLAFFGSILGGLIGGLCTFLGVRLTLKHEREKEFKEIQRKAVEDKPRLEVIKYLDFEATKSSKKINNDCNVLFLSINGFDDSDGIPRFYYNEKALDLKNLSFVEYCFKNTGKTEIDDVCITTNLQRNTAVFELERRDIYITENLLNYEVWANKRYIKPGQEIKIRVYYSKDEVIGSMISYPLTIWLHDINGRYWEQNFGSPNNDVEISRLSNRKTFRDHTNIDTAIDCFKNPYLW